MTHIEVEEYDLYKLEEALNLVDKVIGYYYMTPNSRGFISKLNTIKKKLNGVIGDARKHERRAEFEQAKT